MQTLSGRRAAVGRRETGGAACTAGQWLVGNRWASLGEGVSFKNFAEALEFTNKVGALAEEIFHHPDIFLAWGKVKITIWTHKIDGLNEADFIFAIRRMRWCN